MSDGALQELPIGAGRGRARVRAVVDDPGPTDSEGAGGAEGVGAGEGGGSDGLASPLPPPAPSLSVAEVVDLVEWDEKKLRAPLRLIGKTVNWRVQKAVGVQTDAGLMTPENLADIGEPGAEILNRYHPTRALASRSTELALVIAIYDYVQETAVKAGRAVQSVEDQAAAQRRAAQAVYESIGEPPPPGLAVDDGEVPDL